MSNSGSFAVTRAHGSDRFYNPPAVRRHKQQLLLQQQQKEQQEQQLLQRQLQMPLKENLAVAIPSEADIRIADSSDESTLSRPNSVCSSFARVQSHLTNFDRLMESITPFVPAQYFSEVRTKGQKTRATDVQPFFCLGDLWDSYKEWSVYGVGVPLMLNGSDSVKQYYVPSLSAIQLYLDPVGVRRLGEDSDAESSVETSSAGSSDCEIERRSKYGGDGIGSQQKLMNLNSKRMSGLTLKDKPPMSSSNDEAELCNSSGQLVFEYMEQEQPHFRKPLFDKVTHLASQFPDLGIYRSCDLSPSSWISVAWYPIYRIPMGQTLQNLDASFLTFHYLSTHSKSIGTGKGQPQFHASSGGKGYTVDSSSKISLPVFGLASYKLRGSILTPNGPHEQQQSTSLMQASDTWLKRLQVHHPDFQFFASHDTPWR